MFNGGAANYADVTRGWTFARDFSERLETQISDKDARPIAFIIGAAGSGKTTGIRQCLKRLVNRNVHCWEHDTDFPLSADGWIAIDDELRKRKANGVLFIDDAHEHLHNVNSLVNALGKAEQPALRIILSSSNPNWNPRLKSPLIFQKGLRYELGALSDREMESLLDLVETSAEISSLVEQQFNGFNRSERKRRLEERCRSDMFVCMRNIFGSGAYDDIVLREYAELVFDYQSVYRQIAGMEAAGVRVHRQMVIRTVGIQPDQVQRYLLDLAGIIEERTVNEREGIYSWHVRHPVIAEIISDYKFSDHDEFYSMIEQAIDNLNPAYRYELASLNELCNPMRGINKRVHDKGKQNVLFRKMMSLAPLERVPRHRLINNLIEQGDYERAATEIRLFENELRADAPIQRYKIKLLLARAKYSQGLMDEDRAALARQGAALAEAGLARFSDNKSLYSVYLEVGVEIFRYSKDRSTFDSAIKAAREAYARILDPDLARSISAYERFEEQHGSP